MQIKKSMTRWLRLRNRKWRVGRHDFLECTDQGFIITLAENCLQIADYSVSGIQQEHAVFHRATDLRMGCWFNLFRLLKQFFEQFFTRTQASIDYADILLGHHPGEHDHVPSQVRHFNLLSHIKDEHLTSPTEYARLENQLNRF